MAFSEVKTDPTLDYLDYTWLISGILYEGGTDNLIPELMNRGINEVYFYNVAGTMIGQKTVAGVSGSFDAKVLALHAQAGVLLGVVLLVTLLAYNVAQVR